MQRLLGFVLDKFSELGPVRKLFKFLFGRIFDNLIDREIKLSDFKNNILELENLPLSTSKINKVYLSDSPYKLHSGVIGKLKIKVASFKELATKDIEVQLDKIHLVFNFNTHYHKQKNFSMNQNNAVAEPEVQDIDLKDEDEEEEEYKQQNGQNQQKQGKQDMFKQFIRQVLSNIKLSINDLVADVYMNEPTIAKQTYVMLRLKKLKVYQQKKEYIHKKLKVQKDKSENLYWIKLKEISAFIIKPNEKQSSMKEFPFNYPGINDIQCIFTTSFKMKQLRSSHQSQDKKVIDQLNQSSLFDYNQSIIERDIKNQNLDDEAFLPNHLQIETLFNPNDATVKSVKVSIPPIEVQLDPIQLKVLQNFSDQFSSYSKMRKINEYKKNNFCQKELHMYSMIPKKVKQNRPEPKKQDEEESQQPNDIFQDLLKKNHFNIQNDGNLINLDEVERDDNLDQRIDNQDNQQNNNLNNNLNSTQSDEYNLISEIKFDFYQTQFDFKIYAVNLYLLKKEIKIDEDKRIIHSKQGFNGQGSNDNEESTRVLYSRNWIYYYDEMNEKIFSQIQQPSLQNTRLIRGVSHKNKDQSNSSSNMYVERTSFNDAIPCSYFLFQLKAFKILTHSPTKKGITIKSIKLIDVNLIENRGIYSEIKQQPAQKLIGLSNSIVAGNQIQSSISQAQQVSNIKNSVIFDQSSQNEIFVSAIGQSHFKESSIRESSYNDSQLFKSMVNDQNNDDLFYSMNENQFPNFNQSNRFSSCLEKIDEEEVDIKKQAIGLKNWKINEEHQHYCITYLLLIKCTKKPSQQQKQSKQQPTFQEASSIIQYKQHILYKTQWVVDETQLIQQPSAIEIELIKKGSAINGQASIPYIYTSFDLRMLRDFYQILYPCDDWGKFTEQFVAYDNKLQHTENISLLEDYSKQSDQIEKYMRAKNQSIKQNLNKMNESEIKQQEEQFSISFQLQIQKFKCAILSYQEKSDFRQALKKNDITNIQSLIHFNNQSCFCSHLIKEARNNKKYLSDNFAFQFNDISFEYKNVPEQSQYIKFSFEKSALGILKINKDLCLESTEPIFKFNNLLEIEQVKLNLVLISQMQRSLNQNQLNTVNLNIGSLQINVWSISKILGFVKSSQNLFQDYQSLLQKLQKFDREQRRSSKFISQKDKDNDNDEDKSEDGQEQDYDISQELGLQFSSQLIKQDLSQENVNALNEFDLHFSINKLDMRIIYLQNYKKECENRKIFSQNKQDQNKPALKSYLFKTNIADKKPSVQQYQQQQQLYSPIQNQIIPVNSCIQFILRHCAINLERGQKINLKIYEIYLIDHLQTNINLGNYKINQNGEDLTYHQLIQQSSDSKEVENKLLIYSIAYNDPKLIEEEQNKNQINHSSIIDLDKPQRRSSISSMQSRIAEGQRQLDSNPVVQPVIQIKASYSIDVESKKIKRDLSPNKINANKQNDIKEDNDLETSVISEDGNDQEQSDNIIKKTTTRIMVQTIAIQDFIIRFGDFRPEIISNFQHLSKQLSVEQEGLIQDEIEKQQEKTIHIQTEKYQQIQSQTKQTQQNESGIALQIKNLTVKNIALDLFPFHDEDIRKRLPKVYQNVAPENKDKGFFTNQRSILLLKSLNLKNLKYHSNNKQTSYVTYTTYTSQSTYPTYSTKTSTSENLELKLSINLDLYTLIFDDFKKHLNPLVLCRQNNVFKDINSLESQIHLDNKSYDFVNQIEKLGFQNIIEMQSEVQLVSNQDNFNVDLQISKLTLTACKDSILAFPLHITLLSLLIQRFSEPLTKEQLPIQQNQQQQQQQSKPNSKNSSIHQNSENENQKQQQQLVQKADSKQQPVQSINNQPQQKNDFDFDFEEIGEEFLIEEKDNNSFIQNAKHQTIDYFHKQNLDDQQSITHVDFTIQKLEIQIFSGKDFDFEQKQKAILSQRKRNSVRESKENLLLLFNQIRVLYSQYPTIKKVNLSINGIELQGTVGNVAQQIIKKKDEKLQLLLLDITIDELKKYISVRTYLARVKVIIDKMHKQLFEDLSHMHIDLEQISVNKIDKRQEENEAYIFNKFHDSQQIMNNSEIKVSGNQSQEEEQKDDESIDDDYEIFNGDYPENNENNNQQYKLSLIQISPIEIEITVNWFVNSILKDSLLKFNEYFNSKEKGIPFNEELVFQLQTHYTKIFDVHIMKNNQLLQIVKDVVLIRNITNLTKNLANIFILPYQQFRNNGRIASGLIEGVKGFQQSIFAETKNFLSVVSNVYSQYIKSNIMKITKIKKLLKNKKPK